MSRDDVEILDVMMCMFSGGKDEYCKDAVPPKPLLFDRVMGGRNIVSQSQLFALPVEILGQIVQYIPANALAALALVNSDCRQLARSQQFKSVHLNYSLSSSSLIQKLCHEALARARNPGPGTYLGPAIRRLLVDTNPAWVAYRHNVGFDRLTTLDAQTKKECLVAATKAFFNHYIELIEIALSSGALPHLELLDWEDMIVLPKSFFITIACSSIQHLRLFRVKVNDEFEIQLPNDLQRCHWPLKSLHLELYWEALLRSGRSKGSLSLLSTSILRLCAPTLETLTWNGNFSSDDKYSFTSNDRQYHFPCLQRLKLSRIKFSDLSILTSFLGPGTRIRELEMEIEGDDIKKEFFAHRGRIETLETLSWRAARSIESLDFLQANSQLSKLRLHSPLTPYFLDTSVLPILSGSFYNLTSLSLVWQGTSISECALEQISTLQGLRQLHLSAGEQYGWKHDWRIEHTVMRLYLSKLRKLRRLAFSRDSYSHTPGPDSIDDIENYYSGGGFEPRDDGEAAIMSAIMSQPADETGASESEFENVYQHVVKQMEVVFEKVHSLRMAKEATQYAHSLPLLEWIYVGQLPMAITEIKGGDREAFSLIEERDECWTALQRMFGLPNSGD